MTALIKTKTKMNVLRTLTLTTLTALNSACMVVGPDYVRPTMNVPSTYKEAPESVESQINKLSTDVPWWAIYNDQVLNKLISQIEIQNYSLQAVEARVRQAGSAADIARAVQSPALIAGGRNDLGLLLNWEIDLWGRVQRNVEANGADVQASLADLAAAKLSLQAQLAQNYFLLRVQDADLRLLQDTVASYERSLQITRNQYAVGVADRGNIAQAQAQLSTAQVQLHDARIARAQLEHTIAILIGKAPGDFSLVIAPINMNVPEVPLALPSDLLERRPDIAAAERRMAAASARIGVAEAEAYPKLNLSIGASIDKGIIGGSQITAPIYTAGATKGIHTKAQAAYDEVVADYRQTVLNGFREVEDNLVVLQILSEASEAQSEAVKAAREVVVLTNNQYKAGIVNYQTIIIVQASALTNERSALGILGRRLVASVTLIKALGGGWESDAPKTKENQDAAHESTNK